MGRHVRTCCIVADYFAGANGPSIREEIATPSWRSCENWAQHLFRRASGAMLTAQCQSAKIGQHRRKSPEVDPHSVDAGHLALGICGRRVAEAYPNNTQSVFAHRNNDSIKLGVSMFRTSISNVRSLLGGMPGFSRSP